MLKHFQWALKSQWERRYLQSIWKLSPHIWRPTTDNTCGAQPFFLTRHEPRQHSRHPQSAKMKKRIFFYLCFFIVAKSELAHTLWLSDKPTKSKSIVRNITSLAQSECNIETTLFLFFLRNYLATPKSWHNGLHSQKLVAGFYCTTVGPAEQPVWHLEFRMW